MTRNQPTNANVVDTCTKRLLALKAHVDPKASIAIDGTVHKAADLIAVYQHCLDTRAVLVTKRAEVKAALADRVDAEAGRRAADRGLKAWVVNHFGASSTEAIEFGFPPPRVATRTIESKAQAVLRAKATREARHTMGKKQRERVKGTMTVLVTPDAGDAQAPPPQTPGASVTPASPPAPQPTSTNGVPTPPSILNGVTPH